VGVAVGVTVGIGVGVGDGSGVGVGVGLTVGVVVGVAVGVAVGVEVAVAVGVAVGVGVGVGSGIGVGVGLRGCGVGVGVGVCGVGVGVGVCGVGVGVGVCGVGVGVGVCGVGVGVGVCGVGVGVGVCGVGVGVGLGGGGVGVGVGGFGQSSHFSMVNRTTYHGSFMNTTVRVQQKTHPCGVVKVPAKYDEPSCCLRLVIARPGIWFGRCAIASGSRAACGQRAIAFLVCRAAFSSAVLNPFPLNCSSERMMFAPSAPFGNAASSSCVNFAIIASIFAAEMWPLLLRCLRCFAASSGTTGAKATRMASTVAICLEKLFFICLFWGGLIASHEGT